MWRARGLVLASLLLSSVAGAVDTTKPIADGVTMITRVTTSPAEVVHALKVDLTTPGVHLGATTSAQRKRSTSSYVKLVGATAGINGDFFSFTTYGTSGLAAGGGAFWTDTQDSNSSANVAFGAAMRVELHDAAQVLAFDSTWMKGVVSGHPQLINGGTAMASNGTSSLCLRNPRTSVGISQDQKTLVMAVVDGRSTASVGMTCVELANLMKSLGAYDAVNFDGGGSTTMYVSGTGVVNQPSDGSERIVGNHLAVFAPRLGSVRSVSGTVYEAPDATHLLEDVSVSIQQGGTDTTDVEGAYALDTLPGTFTVTAKKPGYATKTVSVTVAAGADVTLDLALDKDSNADFDGDGVPDAQDRCPQIVDPDQRDTDGDRLGDACDADDDGDGLADEDDNCPLSANADQADADQDGIGDACNNPDGGTGVTGELFGCSTAADRPTDGAGWWIAALALLVLGAVQVRARRRASRR